MKPLAANTLLQNRYLIVHLIGKGGMGEVYLAIDQRLGSAAALKRTFFSGDVMLAGAFEREARTLARLRHGVLPKVSDHFIEGDHQYLIMEHIAGDDLAKRLEISQKPFPLDWVMFWADALLDALDYLHAQEPPVIHRDIKPQNLKLTDENSIVLLDFGLSKNTPGETRTSTTGSVVGYTPHYAPMEQIRGTGTDARSDIYSLSATLYQLFTNIVPPDVLTRADALLSGKADPLKSISEIDGEISEKISDVILKGMAVSQQQRFSGAREMQKALRDAHSRIKSETPKQNDVFEPQTRKEISEISQSQLKTNVSRTSAIESNPPNSFAPDDGKQAEELISQPHAQAQKKNSNLKFLTVFGFGAPLILALAAGFVWFILRNSESAAERISVQTPEAVVSFSPSPTPMPEANANISVANTAANSNAPGENNLTAGADGFNENRTSDGKIQNSPTKPGKSATPVARAAPKQPMPVTKKTASKPTPTPAAPKTTPLPKILP